MLAAKVSRRGGAAALAERALGAGKDGPERKKSRGRVLHSPGGELPLGVMFDVFGVAHIRALDMIHQPVLEEKQQLATDA